MLSCKFAGYSGSLLLYTFYSDRISRSCIRVLWGGRNICGDLCINSVKQSVHQKREDLSAQHSLFLGALHRCLRCGNKLTRFVTKVFMSTPLSFSLPSLWHHVSNGFCLLPRYSWLNCHSRRRNISRDHTATAFGLGWFQIYRTQVCQFKNGINTSSRSEVWVIYIYI